MISLSAHGVVAHCFGFGADGARDGALGKRLHPGPRNIRLVTLHQRDRQTFLRVSERSDVVSLAFIFAVSNIVANAVINESSHWLIAIVFDGVEEVGGDSDFFSRPREEGAVDVRSDGRRSSHVVSQVRQFLQVVRLSVGELRVKGDEEDCAEEVKQRHLRCPKNQFPYVTFYSLVLFFFHFSSLDFGRRRRR